MILVLISIQSLVSYNIVSRAMFEFIDDKVTNFRGQVIDAFDTSVKQIKSDADMIRAIDSLDNYIDYYDMDDQDGMDEQSLRLEIFLAQTGLHKLEFITQSGSVIKFLDGNVNDSPSDYEFDQLAAELEEKENQQQVLELVSIFTDNNSIVLRLSSR